jgi:sugar/nucleoside kinase (ribokinase family)
MGVELDLAIAAAGEGATGRCHVFITDDAQRTMATYLGASNQLRVSDINETADRALRDHLRRGLPLRPAAGQGGHPQGRQLRARHDSMVALSLSDMFCVDRHRRDFLELVTHDVDVLLCNETEICRSSRCRTWSGPSTPSRSWASWRS